MSALTAKQALADIEKRKPAALYYLYGEEPFKIAEFVEKAAEAMFGVQDRKSSTESGDRTFCLDRIDGPTSTGSDVLEAVQSMGLFGGGDKRRLVIVRQAHQLKEVDALAELLMDGGSKNPWGDNLLLLCAESLDGRRKFHQWIKKQNLAIEFKPARDAELAQWVQYLSKKAGAVVTREAAEMLAVACDGSLYRLAQEIEKAWLFAGAVSGTEVNAEHVAGVAASRASPELALLVRAIVEGKRVRAMLLSEKLINSSDEALGLVGFLTWALKNSRGGFTGEVAGGLPRKRKLLRGLLDLDLRLKSTGAEARALVEQFVIEHMTA